MYFKQTYNTKGNSTEKETYFNFFSEKKRIMIMVHISEHRKDLQIQQQINPTRDFVPYQLKKGHTTERSYATITCTDETPITKEEFDRVLTAAKTSLSC